MTDFSIDTDTHLEAMWLPPEAIALTDEQITQARDLSQQQTTERQRWHRYLQILALLGIRQWFQKRAPELAIEPDWHTALSESTLATGLEQIRQLRIGQFRLSILVTDSLDSLEVAIPESAMETAALNSHWYVLVQVLEELGQVWVRCVSQHSHLVQQLRSHGIQPDAGIYWLAVEWFEQTADHLLLWLRCLDTAALTPYPSPVPSQPAINVGLWLRNQLDQLAQELTWTLLPPLALSSAFRPLRSVANQFQTIAAELENQVDLTIPPQARGAYQDSEWEMIALRLYVITWELPASNEWTLLFILGSQADTPLPLNTGLRVRDATQLLEETMLGDRPQNYLYAQVVGNPGELFWVTICLPDGVEMNLPPFTFER